METNRKKHVIIIGGGFGGLHSAMALSNTSVNVTLIDKRNFHLFQPLLYQVATGGLSPADIASPLRAVFKKQRNIRVVLGTVKEIDLDKKQVRLLEQSFSFDKLIIAAGANPHYFDKNQWAEVASGLKTIEDATTIRSNVLSAFEKAELESEPNKKAALLTFTVIGGGPAGVEMAGAIAEIARVTMRCDFRTINPSLARIVLIEGNERILSAYPEDLSAKAQATLNKLGVEVLTASYVTDIQQGEVTLKNSEGSTRLATQTMIWAAGVKAASLSSELAEKYNLSSDRAGRIKVTPDCTIPGYPDTYVIGDMAHFRTGENEMLPGVAPVAMQQGRFAANHILKKKQAPFVYTDKGNLAVIGRKSAVAFRGNVKLSGPIAWILWIFVHLLFLVGAENRILVAIQWGFNYFTFGRSARLIVNNRNAC